MTRIISLVLLIVSITFCASASDVNIFGIKRYDRTTGKPNEYQDSFNLPAIAKNPFILKVINGASDGSNRVSSGTVSINGVEIFKQSDFSQQVGEMAKEVTLQNANTIDVKLSSKPGSYITIDIVGELRDTAAPVVNLQSPIENLITNQTSVIVAGMVADETAVSLTVNGQSLVVGSDETFSTLISLAEGLNTIAIVATDEVGNVTTISRTVILDTQSPIVNLQLPIDSMITNQPTVITVFDSTSVQLTIQAGSATPSQLVVSEDGSFSTSIQLIEGFNTITVTATDAVSNSTIITRIVRLVTQPPIITIIAPPDSSIVNTVLVPVSGTVTGAAPLSLIVASVNVPIVNGNFNTNVQLHDGYNLIQFIARDVAGNSTIITRTVYLDITAPALLNISPANGSFVYDSIITMTGTVSDEHSVAVFVNGYQAVIANSTFSIYLPLKAGNNIITISATDVAGNATTETINVSRSVETLPLDPVIVAPPINQTVATTMDVATEFLYTGSNPIQKDVTPGTIEPLRVAVLRGKVLKNDLTPLPGVKITILNHPELGYTYSRTNGMFDIAVNGGGLLTVDYQKDGYLPLQRQINAPWQDYVVIDNVIMLQLDPVVTTIDFSEPIQVAQSSVVQDQDGQRQATLFFEQGTTAKMVLANGDSVALPSVTVRATEYTVGENGPEAMPAKLPATSGYTYCVELSVDEALQAGAKTVIFDKPVPVYIDNFLGFPIGLAVPTAYYDKEKGVWVPIDDGRIIKIVGNTNGLAEIDIDGDDVADLPDSLLTLGIDEAERQKLASTYAIGKSLSRIEVTHFSSYDPNYGEIAEDGSEDPEEDIDDDDNDDDPCSLPGSIIGVQNQSLGEVLPITGTQYAMHYQSNKVSGRKEDFSLTIPLSGDSIPAVLKKIHLEIKAAGQTFKKEFSPNTNLKYKFEWDRKDAYGRFVQGSQPIEVRIGYAYKGYYTPPPEYRRTFGLNSGSDSLLIPTREDVIRWQEWHGRLGNWDALAAGFGGWTLSVNHIYDPSDRVLHFGDGGTRSAKVESPIISTTAGNGSYGYDGDGGPAQQATLDLDYSGIVDGPDGSLYIADSYNNRIRRISPNGIITTVAGNGDDDFYGDGGLAVEAALSFPTSVALSSDGRIFVADYDNERIRCIDTDGIITTVAGNGDWKFSGDGGSAIDAGIDPISVITANDGSIYIADYSNARIRKISPDGFISTIAGTGEWGFSGDGGPAMSAQIDLDYTGMAVTPDGSLYFSDYYNNRVRRISPEGIITTVAGNGESGGGGTTLTALASPMNTISGSDSEKATEVGLSGPVGVAIGSDGSLYIAESDNDRIRKVDPIGNIITIAGTGNWGYTGDGYPALRATFDTPCHIALSPDGSLYISEEGNSTIRRISQPFPGLSLGDMQIPSEDGSEVYIFNSLGKHLRTLDALTGTMRYSFNYDIKERLISVRDIDSLVTTIERDSIGNPTAIISPYGQRTAFGIDNIGYISSITNPAGEQTRFTFTNDGLMTSLTDPKLNTHTFAYDTLGRLVFDADPAGGFKQLDRIEIGNGYEVTVTTAEGRKTKYRTENLSTDDVLMTNTNDAGIATISTIGKDGITTTVSPDGTITTSISKPDPRYGMQAALTTTTTRLPGGLTTTTSQGRTISQMTGLTVTGMKEFFDVNGRKYTSAYSTTEGSTVRMGTNSISDYSFSTAVGSFTSIIGQPGTISAGNGDDNTYSNIPIGFYFSFSGNNYSQIAVCTNGWISFNASTSSTSYNSNLIAASAIYPLVAPLFDDLMVSGSIYYNTSGTAPQRKFTVEWNNVKWNYNSTGNTISFQVIFYEETGTIQYIYTPGTASIYRGSAAIGMANADGFLSVSNLTSSATVSQTTENDYIAVKPPAGLTFSFTPPPATYVDVPAGGKGIFVNSSPEGRKSFSFIDAKGRTIKDTIPGVEATNYSYDPKGRLLTVSQSGRTATYTYDTKSFLATATDPISRISRFEYDSVGRITRQILPRQMPLYGIPYSGTDGGQADNHEILYSYDANGNLTTLTPPSKPNHTFNYSPVDLTTQYAPPMLDTTNTQSPTPNTYYQYNKDKQIVRVLRPDGGIVEMIYDSVGCSTCGSPVSRPKTILFDRGALNFKYSSLTGNLDSLISPLDTLIYTYDGSLPKSVTSRGEINGFVSVAYDSNYRVTSQSINGGNTVNYLYDNDGLLTQTGEMEITREVETGRISNTSLGNVSTSQVYNNLGELSSYEAKYGATTIFGTNYQRDSLGRITQILETVQGQQKKMNYSYDIAGRLATVKRNDTLISTYSYDPNGNRIAHVTQTSADSGTYDSQDRMLTYGNAIYVYTRNGELQKKIEDTDTTHYNYDYFGNLLSVKLSNGDLIEYLIDGLNRRIGKKVNGQTVKRWIYSGQLSPVAELDSAGNVASRFVGDYFIRAGQIYKLIRDHLGSIRLVIDIQTNTIIQRLEYDEYGNVLINTNPEFQPLGYASGLYDVDTKLIRFGYRDYDASIGRWISKDPIMLDGGSNTYIYCYSEPINYVDSYGNKPGDKYNSPNRAAVDAIRDIQNISKATGNEWGGWIYQNEDGTYSYTKPIEGECDKVPRNKLMPKKPKKPKIPVGVYHTHTDPNVSTFSDEYRGDIAFAHKESNNTIYVGITTGEIQGYSAGWPGGKTGHWAEKVYILYPGQPRRKFP